MTKKRGALVVDGVVTRISIFRDTLPETRVDVTGIRCGIGWLYDGTNFTDPEPPPPPEPEPETDFTRLRDVFNAIKDRFETLESKTDKMPVWVEAIVDEIETRIPGFKQDVIDRVQSND